MATFNIKIGSATHAGKRRKINQDYLGFCLPKNKSQISKGSLFVLADGMGGYSGGEIASKMAVEYLINNYYTNKNNKLIYLLRDLFRETNQNIFDLSQKVPALTGMGTTLTAVIVKNQKLYCAHVGDSRVYLISSNKMIQLTPDHSYVADLIRSGSITKEEAKNHPKRNIITRAVGADIKLKVDMIQKRINFQKTPYLLICCDGLYREVSEDLIIKTVFSLRDPQSICDKLVMIANENGGSDNISVIVVLLTKKGVLGLLREMILKYLIFRNSPNG